MTICEELRQAVLQAAIQGKLTEQKEEDGTAEELLEEIRREKERLVKEGKIKREKALPEITEDEIPFDIPENWKWCHLVDLGVFSSGKTPDMTNRAFWDDGTVHWTTSKDMKGKYLNDSQMYITELAASEMKVYPRGTLLMVVRSGILKRMLPVCILNHESTINQDLKAYAIFVSEMSDYLYFMLKGLEPDILLNYTKRVTTVDSLKFEEFSRSMPVPLPPLAEQQRIVTAVNTLMTKIDSLKLIEDELISLRSTFSTTMRDAILQAAMQGKLTEQLESDGTAEELYLEIQEEKKRLIKEGKIKKEKALEPISKDEIPFDIPENWKWVRLVDLGYITTGGTPSKENKDYYGDCIPFYKPGDITSERYVYKSSEYLSELGAEKARILPVNSIIVVCIGTIGKCAIISKEGATNQQINAITPLNINHEYIYYILNGNFLNDQMIRRSSMTTLPIINKTKFGSCVIPLPPLTEQYRIVARLNVLLPLCDTLEEAK